MFYFFSVLEVILSIRLSFVLDNVKLLFKMISWPTWELQCTYVFSLVFMLREIYQEILGARKTQKSIFVHKHVLLYACVKGYGRGVFLGPDARFHTMRNALCLMERILHREFKRLGNIPGFSLMLSQLTL